MTSSTDPVLALGRELAAHLDQWDVLGRWMAHHLAELIEKARDSEDATDRDAAAQMTLRIWRQRHTLGDKYPLHNYDAIFNTLDHLSDRTSATRLVRHFGTDGPSDAELDVNGPLQLAVTLEEVLQDVHTWLLAEAADAAQDHDAPWVQLAREQRENDEARALRRISRMMREFRSMTDQTTSDESAESKAESDATAKDANHDDPVLSALDRSLNLLTTLRDARGAQVSGDKPSDE